MYKSIQILRLISLINAKHTVTDLLKVFLGNTAVNTANMQKWKMCLSGRMLLRIARQQRTNEDTG
jgi:hypothetical protein